MTPPSKEFMLLAATLIESLPANLPIEDTLLLQLHAVFGPMLMSALQLMDKREVVRVILPSKRYVYQVASSTGKNYTLYLDPPSPSPSPIDTLPSITTDPFIDQESDTALSTGNEMDIDGHGDRLSIPTPVSLSNGAEAERQQRIFQTSRTLEKMYCPCPGFAYNSLSGDRTIVCKHILAVILAHKLDKDVKAEVELPGVIGLLGLN